MRINNNEHYEKRIVFNLRHEYFPDGEVPISLSATGATHASLLRNEAVFRRDASNSWSVCALSGKRFGGDNVLHFEIRPLAKDFYYYSLLPGGVFDGWNIADGDSPGVWKAIEIPFEDCIPDNAVMKIEIEIKTVEKYIEFFLIPKYNPPKIRLRLAENKGGIVFGEPENVRLWDNGNVQRVVSAEPLTMKYPRPFKMKLWEIRNGGERLLSDSVPLPVCDSPSPFSPKDTIATYFYY